jgi:hypothetical protein
MIQDATDAVALMRSYSAPWLVCTAVCSMCWPYGYWFPVVTLELY